MLSEEWAGWDIKTRIWEMDGQMEETRWDGGRKEEKRREEKRERKGGKVSREQQGMVFIIISITFYVSHSLHERPVSNKEQQKNAKSKEQKKKKRKKNSPSLENSI